MLHAKLLSCVWLFVTPWTAARQASLSMRILQAGITGVDSHALLQRIFLTQASNRGLLYCRRILYWLSYEGNPYINIYTGISCFSKNHFTALCFYKRTTSVPIFTDIIFFFIKGKTKVMFSIFAVSSYRARHTSGCQSSTSSSFPGNYTQHQVVIALNCVWSFCALSQFILAIY